MGINNLITPDDFAEYKGITVQWAHRLMHRGAINRRVIAGRHFVIFDDKAKNWVRKRTRKVRKQF